DPGLAFGTGTHPTTALCLEWLDGASPAGARVLDYGCGSGVLAIAAARLGAAHVWATDNDPQALEATRENARLNGVRDRLTVAFATEAIPTGFDVTLANILAGVLVELAPVLTARTRRGGVLVLSGIREAQRGEVEAAYAPAVPRLACAGREGWVRLAGTRAG
ncbi:MAG: methyltransferase, partial [Gammaproteobacteria bacterium]|nr:methyltransferase [Gammaproteobacteria bacterium]